MWNQIPECTSTGLWNQVPDDTSTGGVPQGGFHRGGSTGGVEVLCSTEAVGDNLGSISKEDLMAKMRREITNELRVLRDEVGLDTYLQQAEMVMNLANANPDTIVKTLINNLDLSCVMKLSESVANHNVEHKKNILKKCVFESSLEDLQHKMAVLQQVIEVFGKVSSYSFNSQYLGETVFNTKVYIKDVQEALMHKSAELGRSQDSVALRS